MKSIVTLLLLIVSVICNSQPTLNATNNATVAGEYEQYYIADSATNPYTNITGAGVTWDYSQLSGYGIAVTDTIWTASATTYASNYPNSDYTDDFNQTLQIYRSNYTDSLVSQGYVFNDPAFGIVEVVLTDHSRIMEYPFTFGNSFTDDLDGIAYATITGGMPIPYSGTVTVEADGYGTLLLGAGSYSNVLRVKLSELSVIDFGAGNTPVERIQYFYFDPSVSKFPIFYHTTLSGNGVVQTAVYSMENLPCCTDVQRQNSLIFDLFPNPVNSNLNIHLGVQGIYTIRIFDTAGKLVFTKENISGNTTLNISDLRTGLYNVILSNGSSISSRRIVVKS